MSQSRAHSAMETAANISIGYVIAIAAQCVVFPLFGIYEPLGKQMGIGLAFTGISLVRSYALRRMFNAWHMRRA
jgi:hypothetical protein